VRRKGLGLDGQAELKRHHPGFSEGFRSFGPLLEEAQARGLLELDEKSGGHITLPSG